MEEMVAMTECHIVAVKVDQDGKLEHLPRCERLVLSQTDLVRVCCSSTEAPSAKERLWLSIQALRPSDL